MGHNRNRRWIIITTTFLLTCLITSLLTGCAGKDKKTDPKSESYFIFDTIVTIRVYDENVTDDHFAHIEQILQDIDRKMSRTLETSEISQVNARAGIGPQKVSPETLLLVKQALHYAELTEGLFDPAVGPLVDLWDIGGDSPKVPAEKDIREMTALVDYHAVQVDEEAGTLYLREPGMKLDLGAIAKGYAADETAAYLRSQNLNSAILDLGGNILALGSKPDGREWTIGVQHPDESRGTIIGSLKVRDQSVVSSGVYERYFIEDDVRYHHILDTASGYPVQNELLSVTIVTESSTDADALSTSVFAMGLADGYAFVEGLDGVEAIFITESKQVKVTKGLKDQFRLTDEDFTLLD